MIGHTPGPWRIWSEKDSGGRLSVLEVCETQDRGRHSHFASVAKHWPEAEANARLIAAAPDLLAALKDLAEAVESMQATFGCIQGGHPEEDDMHFHEKWAEEFLKERMEPVRAAIAKAEGNQA
jgi:hypothetical protein